jgi:LysR family transcriptional regulator, transcriptional activator for bauABCD operon
MKTNKLQQLTDFDLKLLRIFKTVAECRSFTTAESVLGISRSAISLHMTDLENRLGLRLCQRGRAGFSLTEQGQHVLGYFEELSTSVEDFRNKINQMHNQLKGELHLGLINNLVTMPHHLITESLAKLTQENPEICLNISMSTLSEIECKVLDQRLHLGAVPLVTPLSGLDYTPLYDEDCFLYCGHQHPILELADVNLNDLGKFSAVRANYAMPESAVRLHQHLHCTATATDREGIAFLILSGKFLGFLPNHYAKKWQDEGLMYPVLAEKMHYTTQICMITRKGCGSNSIVEHFFSHLHQLQASANGTKKATEVA